mmetsp:Transcript_55605/g.102916  ORF Transcript_55605/g.102916 Transcript_55605/m.102916 type:complete len:88 (-) Transcript_55605:103-366(-)
MDMDIRMQLLMKLMHVVKAIAKGMHTMIMDIRIMEGRTTAMAMMKSKAMHMMGMGTTTDTPTRLVGMIMAMPGTPGTGTMGIPMTRR